MCCRGEWVGGSEPPEKEQLPGGRAIRPVITAHVPGPPPSAAPRADPVQEPSLKFPILPSLLAGGTPQNSWEGPWTHLFQLDLRVDLDIADLTVEGSVLGRGLWFPRSGRPQSRVSFDGAQPTSGLQNCLVLST